MNIRIHHEDIQAPATEHADFPATEARPGFSTTDIKIGDDTITVFLPFGGRLTYHNEHTENA
jgi:hypothetical protein